MKENNTDTMNYQAPVLRIAFKKSAGTEVVKQLPGIDAKKSEKKITGKETGIKKKNFPEFYQHQIKPKRFDFY